MAFIPQVEKLSSITLNTFHETVRQPVYALIIAIALGLLLFAPSLSAFTFADDNVLLRDMALSTLLLAGLFIAAFSASGVISEEIENRTVLTVISKPVGRPIFVVGKYLGVAVALVLAMYVMTLGALMIVRHGVLQTKHTPVDWVVITFGTTAALATLVLAGLLNYVYDWKFPPTAVGIGAVLLTVAFVGAEFLDPEWQVQSFGAGINISLVWAFVLILMAVLVLSALAVAVSTRFNTASTLLICCLIFVLGLVSEYYFEAFAADSGFLGKIPYAALPNLQAFWVADALQAKDRIDAVPFGYVLQIGAYSLSYIVAVLLVGVGLFQTREVG